MNYDSPMSTRGENAHPIRSLVDDVEAELSARLPTGGSFNHGARQAVLAKGAKRARPELAGLCLGLDASWEGVRPTLVTALAAVELIHGASLLHDDVLDRADSRRGLPSARAQYGDVRAVLLGDYLLARVVSWLLPASPIFLRHAVDVIEELTRAVYTELEARGGALMQVQDWTRMAEGKSGALFGLAARAPAVVAGAMSAGARLDVFGRQLGLAFQIADDVLDLVEGTGELAYADLREGNPSLPCILAATLQPSIEARLHDVRRGLAPAAPLAKEILRVAFEPTLRHFDDAVLQARAALLDDECLALEPAFELGQRWRALVVATARAAMPQADTISG